MHPELGAPGFGRTGVIPEEYGDQSIKFTIPYLFTGSLVVEPTTNGTFFPESTFENNVDKPFEIWWMNVRLNELDENKQVVDDQPPFFDMANRIRITVFDTSKNEKLTKTPTLVENLVTSKEGAQGTWQWHRPYTLVRAEQLQIQVDTQNFRDQVPFMRVSISFHGYLLVLQPASETR